MQQSKFHSNISNLHKCWTGTLPRGSPTQLKTHLKNSKERMHQEVWLACQAAAKEEEKAIAEEQKTGKTQIKIGDRQTKFNHLALRSILTNWVSSSDRAFIELENPWLQKAFEYCNPQALLALKTGNTVKADIKRNFLEHEEERRLKLKVNVCYLIIGNSRQNLDHIRYLD